jgi:TetR/AcrR family transcriptional regulator, regulator of autoinduction and epiphytic fitness
VPAGHAVGVAAANLEAGLVKRGRPQRALERDPARADPHGNLVAAGQLQLDWLGAGRQPPAQRAGEFGAQCLLYLRPEAVCVVELHDAEPRPAAIRCRPRVALDRDDLVASPGQSGAGEQAGRPCAYDRYSHDAHPIRYTDDALIALMVHQTRGACQDADRGLMSQPAKRYVSEVRDEQARRTRRAIVAAARGLFLAQGYAATTIDAIAEAAHVSRRTVFNAVGGKVALLKLALDWAIVGDDEPVAMADRPAVAVIQAERDPQQALALWVRTISDAAARTAPIGAVLYAAADGDPDAADLLAESARGRMFGARAFVAHLAALDGLAAGISEQQAADVCWALMDGHLYRLLVGERGWTTSEYERWLTAALGATLLRPLGAGGVLLHPFDPLGAQG